MLGVSCNNLLPAKEKVENFQVDLIYIFAFHQQFNKVL